MNLRNVQLYGFLMVVLLAGGLSAWDGGDALSTAAHESADSEWNGAAPSACLWIWGPPQTQSRIFTWLPLAAKISQNDKKTQSSMPFQMAYHPIFQIPPQPSLLSLDCSHQI